MTEKINPRLFKKNSKSPIPWPLSRNHRVTLGLQFGPRLRASSISHIDIDVRAVAMAVVEFHLAIDDANHGTSTIRICAGVYIQK
jgi:hypothetical protein